MAMIAISGIRVDPLIKNLLMTIIANSRRGDKLWPLLLFTELNVI